MFQHCITKWPDNGQRCFKFIADVWEDEAPPETYLIRRFRTEPQPPLRITANRCICPLDRGHNGFLSLNDPVEILVEYEIVELRDNKPMLSVPLPIHLPL